jgi:hypothetical protein
MCNFFNAETSCIVYGKIEINGKLTRRGARPHGDGEDSTLAAPIEEETTAAATTNVSSLTGPPDSLRVKSGSSLPAPAAAGRPSGQRRLDASRLRASQLALRTSLAAKLQLR